jgi:hypothetical protein
MQIILLSLQLIYILSSISYLQAIRALGLNPSQGAILNHIYTHDDEGRGHITFNMFLDIM